MEHYCAAVSVVSLSSQYMPLGPVIFVFKQYLSIKAKETWFGLKAPTKGSQSTAGKFDTLEDPKKRSSIIETSSGKDGLVGFHVFLVSSGIELLDVNKIFLWKNTVAIY